MIFDYSSYKYSNIRIRSSLELQIYSYSYSFIFRITNIFVFVFGSEQESEYIRIRIRVTKKIQNIFVFVFGPKKNIRYAQRKYKQVVDSPEAPTTLVIGEIGDFIRSEEFGEKRIEFANMLYEFADESIKMRTVMSS